MSDKKNTTQQTVQDIKGSKMGYKRTGLGYKANRIKALKKLEKKQLVSDTKA
jgi:hypothetical protein